MTELAIFLPHLNTGGIERNMVRLAPRLSALGVTPRFILQQVSGDLLSQVADDFEVIDLGASSMRGAAKALEAELRARPVDIVMTATNATNIAALLAKRRMGQNAPALVIGEHIPVQAFLETRKRPWLRRFIMRALYRKADRLVAPSQPILDEHRALLGRACPAMSTLPNPVVERVANAPVPLAERATGIITIGRLSPEKDFRLALEVMAKLAPTHPDMHLTIYGEGPERPALEAQIETLNLDGVVTLAGRTDAPLDALKSADLFLCSSKVEGFGNAIVEAQSVGVPVVSVDCPFGPAILLDGGRAGLLVDSRAPDVLASALEAFASNLNARRAAQTAGQAMAQRYSVEASAEAHVALIQEVLDARSGS